MTFQDKIDKILVHNKLGISSVANLETVVGVGVGTISKPMGKNKAPGLGTIKKIIEVLGINEDWWRNGNGPIFKHDSASRDAAINGIEKEFIESTNPDYWMVPKSLLEDKYRMVEVSILDTQKRTIEALLEELKFRRQQTKVAEA